MWLQMFGPWLKGVGPWLRYMVLFVMQYISQDLYSWAHRGLQPDVSTNLSGKDDLAKHILILKLNRGSWMRGAVINCASKSLMHGRTGSDLSGHWQRATVLVLLKFLILNGSQLTTEVWKISYHRMCLTFSSNNGTLKEEVTALSNLPQFQYTLPDGSAKQSIDPSVYS